MGIEPTWDFVEFHAGFEDQERHQAALHLLLTESDLGQYACIEKLWCGGVAQALRHPGSLRSWRSIRGRRRNKNGLSMMEIIAAARNWWPTSASNSLS